MLFLEINLEGIIPLAYTCIMFHTNQKTVMNFNFIYFVNFKNTAIFIWNDQDNTWDLWETADSSNPHKYEFTGNEVPDYVKEAFEAEGCISDRNGIRIGNFETIEY